MPVERAGGSLPRCFTAGIAALLEAASSGSGLCTCSLVPDRHIPGRRRHVPDHNAHDAVGPCGQGRDLAQGRPGGGAAGGVGTAVLPSGHLEGRLRRAEPAPLSARGKTLAAAAQAQVWLGQAGPALADPQQAPVIPQARSRAHHWACSKIYE
jgi:hypothetical protein